MSVFAVALLIASQPAVDPAVFAPGVDQLRTHLTATYALLGRSEAIGQAVKRVHNRFSEKQAQSTTPLSCADAEARSLTARSRPFGAAYRDAVQSARSQATRLSRLLSSPTLTPVLTSNDLQNAERLLKSIRDHARAYEELSGWHAAHIEPYLKRCSPTLEPAAGIASSAQLTEAERSERTAIAGIGGGRICPGGHPADGRVVVLETGQACYSSTTCDCVPERVLPGAVLGAAP